MPTRRLRGEKRWTGGAHHGCVKSTHSDQSTWRFTASSVVKRAEWAAGAKSKSKARVPPRRVSPRVAGCRRDEGEPAARCVLRARLATAANGDTAPHGSKAGLRPRPTSVWTSRGLRPCASVAVRPATPAATGACRAGYSCCSTPGALAASGACRLRRLPPQATRGSAVPSGSCRPQVAADPGAAGLPTRVHRC